VITLSLGHYTRLEINRHPWVGQGPRLTEAITLPSGGPHFSLAEGGRAVLSRQGFADAAQDAPLTAPEGSQHRSARRKSGI